MALRPKHRREIRDLLEILLVDKVWQPRHTDALLDVVRQSRSDVADEIESTLAAEHAAMKREALSLRKDHLVKMRELDYFRDEMKGLHGKVHALLEAFIDLPMAKAMLTDPETGEVTFDPTLISDRDAKVALSAIEKILRITGANAPTKVDIEGAQGSVFELPAWEAEEIVE